MKTLRKTLSCAIALGLAAAPLGFAQQAEEQPATRPATQPAAVLIGVGFIVPVVPVKLPAWPAGFSPRAILDREQINDTLASATEAALTEDGFDDLIERLVDQDRNRLGMNDFAEREFTTLNDRAALVRKAFMDKYGMEFDIEVEERVFDDRYALVQGEVSNPALIMNHWPVPAAPEMAQASGGRSTALPEAQPAAARDLEGGPLVETRVEAQNLEEGRNVAIMGFPRVGHLPELHVSLIHEAIDAWRIDIPNHITGRQLHDALLRNLTYLNEHVNDWPANPEDARRLIAQNVIAALYDVGPQTGRMNGARTVDQADRASDQTDQP